MLVLALVLWAPPVKGFQQSTTFTRTTRPTAGNGLVIGRVVDGDSGAPLPGVIVTVRLPPNPNSRGNGLGAVDSLTLSQIAQTGAVNAAIGGSDVQLLTDSDGWFVLRNLLPGPMAFRGTLGGYTGGGYNQRQADLPGQTFMLADGQQVGDLTLKMWKLGSITGTVVDEHGDPVVGAFVRVLRRTIVGGRPVLTLSGLGRNTDDRGQYRAFGLTPGDYVVCVPSVAVTAPLGAVEGPSNTIATPNGEVTVLNVGGAPVVSSGQRVDNLLLETGTVGRGSAVPPPVDGAGKIFVYPTVFYPSGATSNHAGVITVRSGEAKTGIDLQLPLIPTLRVSGTIVAPDGPASGLQVHLVAAGADQGLVETAPDDVATAGTDGQGQFTLLGVPRGSYEIKVTRQTPQIMTRANDGSMSVSRGTAQMLWAALPVVADQTDLAGLSLILQPGYTVGGRMVFEGLSPQPNAQQMGRSNLRLLSSQAGASRAGGPGQAVVTVNADGTFSAPGYLPGRYTVIPPQWPALKWVPKSMVVGGVDVSDVPIDLAGDVTNLTVTFTDKPAQVTGTVRDASNRPDPNAIVVVFPPDPHAWGWPNGLHTRSTPVNATGTFTFPNLPAGDYAMVAIPEGWQNTWRDPAILQTLLPSATRVQLRDGDARAEDLHTAVIR